MKLKTIKDFWNEEEHTFTPFEDEEALFKELKKVAIKRIKYYLTKIINLEIVEWNIEDKFNYGGSEGKFTVKTINSKEDIMDVVFVAKIEELSMMFNIKEHDLHE